MPGNEPSNGKVRQPVTIRNGSICTQKHVYEHPWELVRLCARARVTVCVFLRDPAGAQVLAAYLDRFPTNPLCKQMANSWTEDEEDYPEEGKQT